METAIRTYEEKDYDSVLSLFNLNTPEFFSPEEEKELVFYLKHELEKYYVIEVQNTIVGSGGINFHNENTEARISWDFVHPDYQKKGIGSALLRHRLTEIQEHSSSEKIIVRTSQIVYKFYEKNGFRLVKQVNDYWAEGFHLYEMVYNANQ